MQNTCTHNLHSNVLMLPWGLGSCGMAHFKAPTGLLWMLKTGILYHFQPIFGDSRNWKHSNIDWYVGRALVIIGYNWKLGQNNSKMGMIREWIGESQSWFSPGSVLVTEESSCIMFYLFIWGAVLSFQLLILTTVPVSCILEPFCNSSVYIFVRCSWSNPITPPASEITSEVELNSCS